MFNVGLTELLVIVLVGIILLDKKRLPMFFTFVRAAHLYMISIKLKTKRLLQDMGIESLYIKSTAEEVDYITGQDGKLHPTYYTDDKSSQNNNDGKDSNSR